jgi:endoglucanase
MKRLTIILILALLSASAYCGPVEKHGKLSVNGSELDDERGKPIVLKGMSFGWHNWDYMFYDQRVVEWLANDFGCTAIRVAVGVDPENGYIDNPEWTMDVISTVIDAAICMDIYVILDWHCHDIRLSQAQDFFGYMAQIYGENPNIIYEIFNEPDDEPWKQVKDYSTRIIDTIRYYDPDNIIIVGAPSWSQDVDVVADDPINGYHNLMYSFHFYAASHKALLRGKMEYAVDKGLPVFVTECSASFYDGDGDINIREFRRWFRLLNREKISRMMWSVSGKDESTAMFRPGTVVNDIGECDCLSPSGLLYGKVLGADSGKHRFLLFIIIIGIGVIVNAIIIKRQ